MRRLSHNRLTAVVRACGSRDTTCMAAAVQCFYGEKKGVGPHRGLAPSGYTMVVSVASDCLSPTIHTMSPARKTCDGFTMVR